MVRGFSTTPDQGGAVPFHEYKTCCALADMGGAEVVDTVAVKDLTFAKISKDGAAAWWLQTAEGAYQEVQWHTKTAAGESIINGAPESKDNQLRQVGSLLSIAGQSGPEAKTGVVGPFKFISLLADKGTTIQRWQSANLGKWRGRSHDLLPRRISRKPGVASGAQVQGRRHAAREA